MKMSMTWWATPSVYLGATSNIVVLPELVATLSVNVFPLRLHWQQNMHLKRQRTAAAETFFSIQNKNSSQGRTNARSSGQHIAGGLTSATTVVS